VPSRDIRGGHNVESRKNDVTPESGPRTCTSSDPGPAYLTSDNNHVHTSALKLGLSYTADMEDMASAFSGLT
jgi:hypothetical protein